MTSIVKKNKTVPIKLNIVAPTINNNNKNNNNKKDVRFQPQNNLQAVGGASLLSRMNYTGSSPTTSSKELVSMVSRHNSIGFPILELLKDPLKVVLTFLDMGSLGLLCRVNKELLIKAYSNEFWKFLTYADFQNNDILVTTNNWRLEYKYLKAKYKRIKNYPKYQMMGLLGRMKKIERETEYIPGFPYYDCDVVAVTFGNNHGNNNNNGRRKRINICRIKI